MRVMAIDYGDARTGVAISDPAGLLAGYTTVIQSRRPELAAEEIAKLAAERQVDELVMGFPRNMDGTEGPRAELYRDFAALLEEKAGRPVRLWDERRTTIEGGGRRSAGGYFCHATKVTKNAPKGLRPLGYPWGCSSFLLLSVTGFCVTNGLQRCASAFGGLHLWVSLTVCAVLPRLDWQEFIHACLFCRDIGDGG